MYAIRSYYVIEAEVRRKGLRDNIKLGSGGIRELEFIVQVYQLIRGGREPGLQVRHLPDALAALVTLGGLPADAVANLQQAYRFLRRVENVLQEIGDQQTQTLPGNERDRVITSYSIHYTKLYDCRLATASAGSPPRVTSAARASGR